MKNILPILNLVFLISGITVTKKQIHTLLFMIRQKGWNNGIAAHLYC